MFIAVLGFPTQVFAPSISSFQEGDLILIQGNSLIGSYPGALSNDLERQLWEVADKYPELAQIIQCESSWQENVCSFAGCQAGMGLAQIIPSSLKYCEEKLGRKLDAFNSQDNLDCAIWLYENEGNQHWSQSQKCWQD